MTARCTLRFDPDKTKGPGYGLITAACPGFTGGADALRYTLKAPSSGLSLGPNGWQPGDERLKPDAVALSGDTLVLSVGPAVVDHLELQAIYQVLLFPDAENVLQGGLSVNRIVYSRDPSLLPDLAPSPKAAPKTERKPLPLPEIDTPSPLLLTPEEAAPSTPADDEPLNMAERPKSHKGLILNILFAILTLLLLVGAGVFFYTKMMPKTDAALEEKPAEILRRESADLPPGQEAPIRYAPDDLKGTRGLQVARDALKRKLEPQAALELARRLLASDVKAQDGAFLLVEESAKTGDAQALLLLGDFYSPAQPQHGTIQKDGDLARDCYRKALAAGAPEAGQRLEHLK